MRVQRHVLTGAIVFAMAGAGFVLAPSNVIPPAYAACGPDAHVDGTTAQSTRQVMERAGYSDIKIDQKGCDNVWHVIATKGGQQGRYAVEPSGKIYPEGN